MITRKQIKKEFYNLYDTRDLVVFFRIKSFWNKIKSSFIDNSYVIDFQDFVFESFIRVLIYVDKFVQKFKPV